MKVLYCGGYIMKDYKHSSLAGLLKHVLNILILAGAFIYVMVLRNTFALEGMNILSPMSILTGILFISGGLALLAIMYYLRRIIDSLIKVTPFIQDNVKSLKRIASACFVVSACYIINFFVNAQYRDFKFVSIDAKGVHTDIEILIFFFAGCFILVLAQVFKQAVEVKEENDFTI
jgi:hypothetical protein